MNFIINIFNTILYEPLLNVLILFYTYVPPYDLGIAVILLTLIIRLIISPISIKGVKSQKALSKIQPKIKEIQNKYKDDKQKQSQEMMNLYKKEKVNPFSGCLPLLLQLPILIAFYQVFLRGLSPENLQGSLYSFVPFPEAMDISLLGIVDLSGSSIVMAILAGGLQFIQSKLSMRDKQSKKGQDKGSFSSIMQNQMTYFFPIITVFIIWRLGSLLGLYWIVSTLFSIGEYYWIAKKQKKEEAS